MDPLVVDRDSHPCPARVLPAAWVYVTGGRAGIRAHIWQRSARVPSELRARPSPAALKPKEEIGAEVHKLDQFFRVEAGSGEAVLNGVRTAIRAGFAVLVPAGANHNIINTGTVPMKLYTLYAPPNHRDAVVHHTRQEAEADNEHFDGKTTE